MMRAAATLDGSDRARLHDVLVEAQQLGFLGPGSLEAQVDRSLAFTAATPRPGRALDLGSGGGLPGLVLALAWPETVWTLLDGSVRRCEFLVAMVERLSLTARVAVLAERAELSGRGGLRASQDLVVARGFGPAAVTAECAAPLLRVGGHLVVTEPPGGAPERWPAAELATLGLEPVEQLVEPVALQVLHQASPCPERFPRRVGIPNKRPLYT